MIAIFQKLNCSKMIAIFIIGMGVAINSTSYKKFPVKTLEDQQKKSVAFIRLISTLVVPLVIVTYGNISIKTKWREYFLVLNLAIY